MIMKIPLLVCRNKQYTALVTTVQLLVNTNQPITWHSRLNVGTMKMSIRRKEKGTDCGIFMHNHVQGLHRMVP